MNMDELVKGISEMVAGLFILAIVGLQLIAYFGIPILLFIILWKAVF